MGTKGSARVLSRHTDLTATMMPCWSGCRGLTTVFYDGKCGLCSKEIDHYRKIAPKGVFHWQDVTQSAEELEKRGISLADSLRSVVIPIVIVLLIILIAIIIPIIIIILVIIIIRLSLWPSG